MWLLLITRLRSIYMFIIRHCAKGSWLDVTVTALVVWSFNAVKLQKKHNSQGNHEVTTDFPLKFSKIFGKPKQSNIKHYISLKYIVNKYVDRENSCFLYSSGICLWNPLKPLNLHLTCHFHQGHIGQTSFPHLNEGRHLINYCKWICISIVNQTQNSKKVALTHI